MLTMRFDIADDAQHDAVPRLTSALEAAARLPRISGAHLLRADAARRASPPPKAKGARTCWAGALGGVAGRLRRRCLGRGSRATSSRSPSCETPPWAATCMNTQG